MRRLLVILSAIAFPSSPVLAQAGALVAHYMCDGNARDTSGNGNHGTMSGPAPVADRFGNPGLALFFDGHDDFISVNNSPSLNPSEISVMAWYKTEDFAGNGFSPFLNKSFTSHSAPHYQYKLGVSGSLYSFNAGRFIFALSINGTMYMLDTPAQSYLAGKWYHVCGTYDGALMKLFIDGILVSTLAVSGSIDSYNTGMMLGNNPTADDFLNGTLDDVRIFNRALSEDELNIITSVKENPLSSVRFLLFPNPASDKVAILREAGAGEGIIELFNSAGQSVKQILWQPSESIIEFSVAGLPEGIYVIVSEEKGILNRQKLVIKR